MNYHDEIDAVKEKPCKCVRCEDCKGSGDLRVSTGGYPEWDLEPCDSCDGGIVEVCDRCRELEEMTN